MFHTGSHCYCRQKIWSVCFKPQYGRDILPPTRNRGLQGRDESGGRILGSSVKRKQGRPRKSERRRQAPSSLSQEQASGDNVTPLPRGSLLTRSFVRLWHGQTELPSSSLTRQPKYSPCAISHPLSCPFPIFLLSVRQPYRFPTCTMMMRSVSFSSRTCTCTSTNSSSSSKAPGQA